MNSGGLDLSSLNLGAVNLVDIIIVLLLVICMLNGVKKGLVKSLFNLFSALISLIVTSMLYPPVAGWLRASESFNQVLRQSIISTLGLDRNLAEQTLLAQTEFISGLKLPDIFTQQLLLNNNSELYRILDVSRVEDYIVEYVINICTNVVAVILSFLLISILLSVVSHALDIITRLPVIHSFNKTGGLMFGVLQGALLIWITFAILSFFFYKPEFTYIFDMIYSSLLGRILFEHNILMDFVLQFHL